MKLTSDQLAQYDRDGYVVVDCPFPAALTQDCLDAVDAIAIDPAANEGDHKGNHYTLKPQIDGSYFSDLDHSLRFLRIELHAEVVELARQLTGRLPDGDEEIYYRNGGINELAPGRCFKWHRDSGDEYTEFMHYFSDATRADGCLRVVPGSHVGPVEPWTEQVEALRAGVDRDAASVYEEDVDLPGEVSLEVGRGQLIVRSSRIYHATWINRSDRGRLMHHWLFRQSTAANHRFRFDDCLEPEAIDGLTAEQRQVLWLGRDFELDPKWDGERAQGPLRWGV
jgi:hypothetical protein